MEPWRWPRHNTPSHCCWASQQQCQSLCAPLCGPPIGCGNSRWYLSNMMRWWCWPPALPRPPGCLRCLPMRPWPADTWPRFLRLALKPACATYKQARRSGDDGGGGSRSSNSGSCTKPRSGGRPRCYRRPPPSKAVLKVHWRPCRAAAAFRTPSAVVCTPRLCAAPQPPAGRRWRTPEARGMSCDRGPARRPLIAVLSPEGGCLAVRACMVQAAMLQAAASALTGRHLAAPSNQHRPERQDQAWDRSLGASCGAKPSMGPGPCCLGLVGALLTILRFWIAER